jgi:peptide deformylase
MIHPIVKYGDPVLEKPAKTIEKFDEELQKLIADMFESMYAAQGVGLAAPQIGIGLRLAVIDVSNGKNPEAKLVCATTPKSPTRKANSARKKAAFRFPASAATSPDRNM